MARLVRFVFRWLEELVIFSFATCVEFPEMVRFLLYVLSIDFDGDPGTGVRKLKT